MQTATSQHAIPAPGAPEYARLQGEWNATATDYPAGQCVHQLFEAQAKRTPHAVAAVHGSAQLTYAELNAKADQFAGYLRRRGLASPERVGICLRRSLDLAVALLGVLKAGGACLPLDPSYPPERLRFVVNDAQSPVVVAGREMGELFAGCAEVVHIDDCLQEPASTLHSHCELPADPSQLAYVIYTSGSTGTPKGVLLPHTGLVNHIAAAVRLYGLQPCDRVLQFSSISFDLAIEEMFPAWSAGAAVVFRSTGTSLDASSLLEQVRRQGITVLDLPAAYWHEMVQGLCESREEVPECLRLVIVGGEQPSSSAYAGWLQHGGSRVRWINTYGPTEASVIASAYEPRLAPGQAPPALLPIGHPIANTRIYILDSNLAPVPPEAIGEIYIGGVGVALGYQNRPELTAERFLADPFSTQPGARMYKTGDLARYDHAGEIEFLGRLDDQVKIRGIRVEPGEVQAVLRDHIDLRDAVVVAKDHNREKRLVAYVVPRAEVTAAELRAFLRLRLPEVMVPSDFMLLEALPITPSGKLDRQALPEPEAASALRAHFLAARDQLEAQLVTVWEEVLQKGPIGVNHNFFDLGGESLLAVRLMHRLEQVLGKKLPLSTLLQAPTVARMAALFREQAARCDWSCLVPMRTQGSHPPLFCVHGQGGSVLRFRDLSHHLGPEQPFYGLQAHGFDGEHPPYIRVEDMAAHYLIEIRQVQNEGPYFLAGYSFGGLVAFEMAHQLQAAGEPVALLALMDSDLDSPGSRLRKFIRMTSKNPLGQAVAVVAKAKAYAGRVAGRFSRKPLPPAVRKIRRSCQAAERAYIPHFYDGSVTLFCATQSFSRRDAEQWRNFAASLDVFRLSGSHVDILQEPRVVTLAEILRNCIERARAGSSSAEVSC